MIGKTCNVLNCSNIITVRGKYCCKHRSRLQRTKTTEPSKKALNRFQPVIQKNGYIRININGKRVLEHIFIMEQFISRKIKLSECVHHKNGIKNDNRIENLELISKSNHQKIHRTGKKLNKFLHKFL